jgi:hypothetical protein
VGSTILVAVVWVQVLRPLTGYNSSVLHKEDFLVIVPGLEVVRTQRLSIPRAAKIASLVRSLTKSRLLHLYSEFAIIIDGVQWLPMLPTTCIRGTEKLQNLELI